jgi:dihydrofolate reductase
MKDSKIYVIVATEKNLGIGKNGKIPWDLKKDMQHFKKITTATKDPNKQNACAMGNITWESLPGSSRPLPQRKNLVLARDINYKPDREGIPVRNSIEDGIKALKEDESVETIFMIGGASIYRQSVEMPELEGIYLTKIENSYDCDTFFPQIPERFNKETLLGEDEENGIKIRFYLYEK